MMTFESTKILDEVGWQLLIALQEDARRSYADLARLVRLSPPAVAERVRRLEEAGIITGYGAHVAPGHIGLPLVVFLHLNTTPDKYPRVIKVSHASPEIVECHHVTGTSSFIIKMNVASLPHLEEMIKTLSLFGSTSSHVVLSTPVRKNVVIWKPVRGARASATRPEATRRRKP